MGIKHHLVKFSNMLLAPLDAEIHRRSQNPLVSLLGLSSRSIGTIVDVGANRGQFADMVRKRFPNAHLICVEPLAHCVVELRKWAERQPKGSVDIINAALGATGGEAQFHLHLDHDYSSSILTTTVLETALFPQTKRQTEITVKMRTLDEIMSKTDKRPGELLIKLDVLGFEAEVIAGGHETFKRANCCIVEVNFHELYVGQPSFEHLSRILNDLGLQYAGALAQCLDAGGRVIYSDQLFTRPVKI